MHLEIICVVFGVIFIAELPDKSMIASLILSTRYRPLYVWFGAAAAFLIHVIVAVTAGQALALLPHRIVEAIVAVLFLVGALFLFFSNYDAEVAKEREEAAKISGHSRSFAKAFVASFGVVFLGEWGDITQITTANYAAHYQAPISVAIGAVLALWTAAAVAVIAGTRLLRVIPATLLQRIAGVILLIFSAISAYSALHG